MTGLRLHLLSCCSVFTSRFQTTYVTCMELSVNLPFSLQCVWLSRSHKGNQIQISPLLKSHTSLCPPPLPNPLKAVYRSAKCLVRSDLLPALPAISPTHKLWIIQLNSTFLHFKALDLHQSTNNTRAQFYENKRKDFKHAYTRHNMCTCDETHILHQKCKRLAISLWQLCVHEPSLSSLFFSSQDVYR